MKEQEKDNLAERLIAELEKERALQADDDAPVSHLGAIKVPVPLSSVDDAFCQRLRAGYQAIVSVTL